MFNKRSIDASVARLAHLHTDIENSVANDNANTTTLNSAVTSATTNIVNNDNANKTTIVDNDNTNKNTIVTNDNANAMMLRDLLLRLQIETDLAAADNATPVALFVIPKPVVVRQHL